MFVDSSMPTAYIVCESVLRLIIIIIIIITVVLIKCGIQAFLRAEQLNASELKKQKNHRKLAFKIQKKTKELDQKITVRIKNIHVHGFSNQCHR